MNTRRIAVLIDGDNVVANVIENLLAEIDKYGKPIINKVFLNKNSLTTWEVPINQLALTPVWVPNNVSGKNAADIELAIDAMQLLYERDDLDGFCIVSSDSDFTGLIKRLIARDKLVLGMGERKTPESFVNACHHFIYIENLPETDEDSSNSHTSPVTGSELSKNKQHFNKLFVQAYESTAQNPNEWVALLDVKAAMQQLEPGFQLSEFQNTRKLADRVLELERIYPRKILRVIEDSDTGYVTHRVRIRDCDVYKFIEAYRHAQKDKHGWLLLSALGSELRKYPVYEDGFAYQGIRQLRKAINKMIQDYGNLIKIREESTGSSVRHLIRISLP